jgi:hypothetical protein
MVPGLADALTGLPPSVQQVARQAIWQAAQSAAEQAAKDVLQKVSRPLSGRQTSAPSSAALHVAPSQQDSQQIRLLQQVVDKLVQQYPEMIQPDTMTPQRTPERTGQEEVARWRQRGLYRWSTLVGNLLRHDRKQLVDLYRHLCLCQENFEIWQREEYKIAHLFLRDPSWVPLFPVLAQRCCARLAQHMRQLWDEKSNLIARNKITPTWSAEG